MNTATRPATPKGHERGGLLLVVVLVLLLGASIVTLSQRDLAADARLRAQARSVAALAQARAALLGFAVSYGEAHPAERYSYGYLPCPDTDNDGSVIGACLSKARGVLGRLPYRTLGLADLRDGWGDCLWYAVAGSIKNNPKPDELNWDSPGQFDLVDHGGRALTVAGDPAARAVAVILAPGIARPGQARPSAGQRCPGSADTSADLPTFLDQPYPNALDGPHTFRQGTADSTTNNDLLTWITVDDIFDLLRRRSDFATLIDGMLDRAVAAIEAQVAAANDTEPRPDPPADSARLLTAHADRTVGALATGLMPNAATLAIVDDDAGKLHDNWRSQMRFAACLDGSACLRVTLEEAATAPGTATLQTCRAVLLFGGERIRSGPGLQRRQSAAERADPAQYLEGDNAANLGAGIPEFAGYRRFTIADPAHPAAADIVKCLD